MFQFICLNYLIDFKNNKYIVLLKYEKNMLIYIYLLTVMKYTFKKGSNTIII